MKGHTEKAYESDSDSDEDSRHNRGKFKSERTGVISLSATTEREAIPDTLGRLTTLEFASFFF